MDIILYIQSDTRIIIQESEFAGLPEIISEDFDQTTKQWKRFDKIPVLDNKDAKKLAYLLLRWYDLKEKLDTYA